MQRALLLTGLVAVLPAFAQHHAPADTPTQAQPGRSAYVGTKDRAIKALSEKQIADLRAGRGMTLALSAELNGYPGPSHALELAGPLGLSEEQKQKTQALFAQMQAEATRLGEQVIAGEHELDRLFRHGTRSFAAVEAAVETAARRQGELRAVHLRYHLLMVDVLTPAQVVNYNELRGYR